MGPEWLPLCPIRSLSENRASWVTKVPIDNRRKTDYLLGQSKAQSPIANPTRWAARQSYRGFLQGEARIRKNEKSETWVRFQYPEKL
jgi:hypothetical protein